MMTMATTISSVEKLKPAFAFFDVDDTILQFKTMFIFQDYYLLNYAPLCSLFGKLYLAFFRSRYAKHLKTGKDRNFINKFYYKTFKWRSKSKVHRAANTWFAGIKNNLKNIYFEKIINEIKKHQKNGVEIVLVSGSMPAILKPIARDIGVENIICTNLEVKNGRYTGKIIPPQTIGSGKAEAVLAFLEQRNGDRKASFAYGDHVSDVSMLEVVGHPHVVSNEENMIAIAKSKGWQCIDPTESATTIL
jgi:HAD superfamily hydrolase (TIGR01490 family)